MATQIIERICNACSCNEAEAQEYLDNEINNLKELRDLDDLRDGDIETACSGLGLDFDYMAYFIEALAS